MSTEVYDGPVISFDGAVCSHPSVDPDLFFSTKKYKVRKAQRLCAACPVLLECGAYGSTQGYGTWGGTTHVLRHGRA